MKKGTLSKIIFPLVVCLITAIAFGQSDRQTAKEMKDSYNGKGYKYPVNGLVPNDTVAIKIAEAVWLPLYGKEIYSLRPFYATLDSQTNIWTVNTSSHSTFGGMIMIKLQKMDGKILIVVRNR